jgi:hypothetical protein
MSLLLGFGKRITIGKMKVLTSIAKEKNGEKNYFALLFLPKRNSDTYNVKKI